MNTVNNNDPPVGQKRPQKNISIIVGSIVIFSVLSAGYMWLAFQIIGL